MLVALEGSRQSVHLRLQGAEVVPHGGKLGVVAAEALREETQRFGVALLRLWQVVLRAVAGGASMLSEAQTYLSSFEVDGGGNGA